MVSRFHSVIVAAVLWCPWGFSAVSYADSAVHFSVQMDDLLVGTMLSNAEKNREVTFWASWQDESLTLQLDLEDQSILVRHSPGELHIDSDQNLGPHFGMLSDDERVVCGRLATLIKANVEEGNQFYARTVCLLEHFSYWPRTMPLAVSMDSLQITVGKDCVDRKTIEQARRAAMAEAFPQQGAVVEEPELTPSLCSKIGTKQKACYPTDLLPYKEKCETVLVGGLECTGRCGSVCVGLCDGARYTKACLDHDGCADFYHSTTSVYCNYIFPPCIDDCQKAAQCVDAPGTWKMTFTWKGQKPGSATWWIYPNKKFKDSYKYQGTWTGDLKNFKLTYTTGCAAVYTGQFVKTRLHAFGAMKCTTSANTGTWSATKTKDALPTWALAEGSETDDSGVTPAGECPNE